MCSVVFMAFVCSSVPNGLVVGLADAFYALLCQLILSLTSWSPAAKTGSQVGPIARDYLFQLTLIVLAMKSTHDSACFFGLTMPVQDGFTSFLRSICFHQSCFFSPLQNCRNKYPNHMIASLMQQM